MIPLGPLEPYAAAIKLAAVLAILGAAFGAGWTVHSWKCDSARSDQLGATVTIERTLREKVPQIVTKVVTKEVTVEREVPRVIEIIRREVAPDCVLPDEFGGMLVDAARQLDGDGPRGPDAASGAYDCRAVLEAVTKDLAAGKRNGARLAGLQEYERLKEKTAKGD